MKKFIVTMVAIFGLAFGTGSEKVEAGCSAGDKNRCVLEIGGNPEYRCERPYPSFPPNCGGYKADDPGMGN